MDWTKQGGSMAENYQAILVPGMFAPCAEILLDAVGVNEGDDVLDVACGTGIVSRKAAARAGESGSVTGVDLGPPMLEVARRQDSEAGAAPIDYGEGDALALPVADEAFDVVLCQHGFQFFADRPAALAEIVRALRPGGRLGIACWTRFDDSPSFVGLAEALRDHLGEEQAAAMRMPFAVSPDVLEQLLADAPLDDVELSEVPVETAYPGTPEELGARFVLAGPLGPAFAELSQERQQAFAAQYSETLRPHARDGVLSPPLFTTIATARRPS